VTVGTQFFAETQAASRATSQSPPQPLGRMSNFAARLPDLASWEWGFSWQALFRGRRWLWTVLVGCLVGMNLWLAHWQFQRYQLRRMEQQQLTRQLARDPLTLPLTGGAAEPVEDVLYRQAVAVGTFDFEHQFVWVGPKDRMDAGPHLVTPLQLPDGPAVLVDRGWLSAEYDTPDRWAEFNVQSEVPMTGILLPGSPVRDPQFLAQQERPVLFWSKMDLAEIESQMPYAVAPYYLHLEPTAPEAGITYPVKTWYTLRTPPSMHAGYMVQWVMSAVTVAFLYLLIVRFLERRAQIKAAEETTAPSAWEA